MNTKNKESLIQSYNKLKVTRVKRWEETIKKEESIITHATINKHMANEIEELRLYIKQMKHLATRIINHE